MKILTWAIIGLTSLLRSSLRAANALVFEKRVKAQEAIAGANYCHPSIKTLSEYMDCRRIS